MVKSVNSIKNHEKALKALNDENISNNKVFIDQSMDDDHKKRNILHRIKVMEESNYEENEIKTFLRSSHMIAFKLSDYISLPRHFTFDISGLFSILFGSRMLDENKRYVKEDNSRFLLIFHDPYCVFYVSISILVFACQIATLYYILFYEFYGNRFEWCNSKKAKSIFAIYLCIVYACYTATKDFTDYFPFELTGKPLDEYCFIVQKKVESGMYPPHTFWFENFLKFFRILCDSKSAKETNKRAKEFYDLFVTILAFSVIVFSNYLLLFTLSLQIAMATSTVDLLQNFISIEIIMHIHEVVPSIFRMKDLSPERFQKSWPLVILSLMLLLPLPLLLLFCIEYRCCMN